MAGAAPPFPPGHGGLLLRFSKCGGFFIIFLKKLLTFHLVEAV
jgi:hypothetical protein